MTLLPLSPAQGARFSALQRAEIAEIIGSAFQTFGVTGFSALQRAEIAEIVPSEQSQPAPQLFQCSSTSRNC